MRTSSDPIEIHVHPIDFDAVRAYYGERGVDPQRLKLVPQPTERWLQEPRPAARGLYEDIG